MHFNDKNEMLIQQRALDKIDLIVSLIRSSKTVQEAKERIIEAVQGSCWRFDG